MPSTSYFFPRAKQGTALGVQAGIGNFGVSLVQFVTPWIIGFAMVGAGQVMTNKDAYYLGGMPIDNYNMGNLFYGDDV